MIIAKSKAEFDKIPQRDFDYEFGGNVDVTGPLLGQLLENERTIRQYATDGIVLRSPENPGLYSSEACIDILATCKPR